MKAFNEQDNYSFFNERSAELMSEIRSKGKEYLLKIDEQVFKKYLYDKYMLEPIEISLQTEEVNEPIIRKELVQDPYYREKFHREVYVFKINYHFIGSFELFKVRPTTWRMVSESIKVDSYSSRVSIEIVLNRKDPEEFKRLKKDTFERAFGNVENINANVKSWNEKLSGMIDTYFNPVKKEYIDENDFFTAINLKSRTNSDGEAFSVPAVRKKIIPQLPQIGKNEPTLSEPMLAIEVYNDILKLLYDTGRNMEKKPSLYIKKEEEALRDQFLLLLETRYDGLTATGEAFNRSGKTDILIKNSKDGSNVFVAECKFWHGIKEFYNAISQLLSYLTWRDSKTALMLFVKNKDFKSVMNLVNMEIDRHPEFKKSNGERGDSSFSYIFSLPQDKNKSILLEILFFHFDK